MDVRMGHHFLRHAAIILSCLVFPAVLAGELTLPGDEVPVVRGHRLARWEACDDIASLGEPFLVFVGRSLRLAEREALLSGPAASLKWMGQGVYLVRPGKDVDGLCGNPAVRGARRYTWDLKIGSTLQEALAEERPSLTMSVSFHDWIDRNEQREVLSGLRLQVLERRGSHVVVVEGSPHLAEILARETGVALVSLTTTRRISFNLDSSRIVRTLDARDWMYGRTGKGITVGVWDGTAADGTHEAFGDRVVEMDVGEHKVHATHVMGTVLANPPASHEKATGMAPAAKGRAWDWDDHLDEKDEAYRGAYITNDTNSWGTAIGWACCDKHCTRKTYLDNESLFGAYVDDSRELDDLVVEREAISTWAAGNDGADFGRDPHFHGQCSGEPTHSQCSHSYRDGIEGFRTIDPHPTAKNVISVGAIDKTWECVTSFSSRGPTRDGRIKPDLVAPGEGVYSTILGNQYDFSSGTSMATPVVAGSIALIAEELGAQGYQPGPELIKAMLIHTARRSRCPSRASETADEPGPDYKYGWGVLDTRAALNIVRTQATNGNAWRTGTIDDEGQVVEYAFDHEGGPLRATLVWTDVPGVADDDSQPDLVVDLDLELVDPNGRVLYRSWYMPYQKTGQTGDIRSPARKCGSDDCTGKRNDRDNVEVADVTAVEAIPGKWKLRIRARRLPEGSIRYAVILPTKILGPEVTSPAGGDTWSIGATRYIEWEPDDDADAVRIEYRCGKDAWQEIVHETENDGQWAWTVAGPACTDAQVRVTRLAQPEGLRTAGVSPKFSVEEPDFHLDTSRDEPSSPNPSVRTETVVFRTRFVDPDGEPASWVRLHLEGPGGARRTVDMEPVPGDDDPKSGALHEARIANLGEGVWAYYFEADQWGLRDESGRFEQTVDRQQVGGCGNGVSLELMPSTTKVNQEVLVRATVRDEAGRAVPDRRVVFSSDRQGTFRDPQRPLAPEEPGDHYRTAYTRNSSDVPGSPELVGTADVHYEPHVAGTHVVSVEVDGVVEPCTAELVVSAPRLDYDWHFRERRREDTWTEYEVHLWLHEPDGTPVVAEDVHFSGYVVPAAGGEDVPLTFDPEDDVTDDDGEAVSRFKVYTCGTAYVTASVPAYDDSDTTTLEVCPGPVPGLSATRTLEGAEKTSAMQAVDWLAGTGDRVWGAGEQKFAWSSDVVATVPRSRSRESVEDWDRLKVRAIDGSPRVATCDGSHVGLLDGDTLEVIRRKRYFLPGRCEDVEWLDDDHVVFGLRNCTAADCVQVCDTRFSACRSVGPGRHDDERAVEVDPQPGGGGRYLVLTTYPNPLEPRQRVSDLYVMGPDHRIERHLEKIAGEDGICRNAAWARDGSALAVTCERDARLYEYPSMKEIPLAGKIKTANLTMGVNEDGLRIVVIGSKGTLSVYDGEDGRLLEQGPIGNCCEGRGDELAWNDEFGMAAVLLWESDVDVGLVNFSGDHAAPVIRFGSYPERVGRDVDRVSIPVEVTDDSYIVRIYRSINDGSDELVEIPERKREHEFTVDMDLRYGDNVLRICAYDVYGNGSGEGEDNPRRCAVANVEREDPPPRIEDVTVDPGEIRPGASAVITARAWDEETGLAPGSVRAHLQNPDETDIRTIALVDDGVPPDAVAGDGIFSGLLESAGLPEGWYMIDVTAEDTRGNRGERDNGARLEIADDPVIGEVSHVPGAPDSDTVVTFRATAEDTSGLASVVLIVRHGAWRDDERLSMREVSAGTYEVDAGPFWTGHVEYRVRATDPHGHWSEKAGEPFDVSCAPGSETDEDGDGYRVCDGDCNDEEPGIHPAAEESCNGLDDDCDGVPAADEVDRDGDGWLACGECADDDPLRHPGADELPNGIDDDCDGLIDERVVALSMDDGWQLVGLAVRTSMSASGMCETGTAAGGEVDKVLRWKRRWRSYQCAVGLGDFDFTPGRGYFVHVEKPFTWSQEGEEFASPFEVELGQGWTLVSLPSWATGKKASEVCEELEAAGCDPERVLHWQHRWRSYDCQVGLGDFELAEGEGFFVRSGASCTWDVERNGQR